MNDNQKHNDHTFSDVFQKACEAGNSGYSPHVSNGLRPAADLVNATRNWAEADIKQQIMKNYASYTNIGQKLNEQRSTLDTHTFEPEIMRSNTCVSSTASQSG